MSQLTKNELKAENQSQFPNNNVGAITPSHLRAFNVDMIDSTVNQTDFTNFSGSVAGEIDALQSFSSSLTTAFVSTASFNSYTQSNDSRVSALESATSSYATAAITASSLITASVSLNTITFTKGDGSTFPLTIDTGSGGGGNISVQDEGSILGDATSFNFNGAGVTATLSAGTASITIPGGGGSIDTGSFATTGSNTFNGDQVVNGYLETTDYIATDNVLYTNHIEENLTNGGIDFVAGGFGFKFNNNVEITGSFDVNGINIINELNTLINATSSYVTEAETSSFATTGSNTFIGNQTINAELILTSSKFFRIGASQSISEGIVGTGLLIESQNGLLVRNLSGAGNILIDNTQGDTTIRGNRTFIYSPGDVVVSGSRTLIQDVDFIPFSASLNTRINSITGSGGTIDTGSFATTGSNTFRGIETFEDAGLNATSLVPTSGSLLLVAKGYNSSSAHLTSSAAGKVNIIFKNTNAAATTYISGSNNIFSDTQAPTAGFKRQLGEANINLFLALPQVSASMGDYVNIDNNFLTARNTAPMTIRGPISSSQWEIKGNVLTQQLNIGTSATNHAQGLVSGLFVNNCYIGANLSVIANRSNTTQQTTIANSNFAGGVSLNMNSSSIDWTNNVTAGGTTTVNNNSTGSARVSINATNAANISSNIFGGNTTITFSGSNDPNDVQDIDYNGSIVRSIIVGSGINARVNTGLTGSNTLAGTAIIGNGLTVSGSSQNPVTNGGTNLGSAFFGRYNALDGNKASSAQTVFAVGTGTNTTTGRKTGFLIDSGSNTYVEGTFNVSGSTTMTGSLLISSSATYDLIITGAARVVSENGLQINTIGPNTFNLDTTRDASVNAENYIFGSTASVASIYVGVYDSPTFNTDVELKLSADSNGISFNDWDNVDGAYENFLTLDANVGNNPIPKFTRGLNVSGSTTLSGSLYIQSGSNLPISTGSTILTYNAATGQVNQASYSTIISASISSAEFWSTTTQSGSAGVSGSITFNNSGSFYNVSLVNGTQLTVASPGVYNIQFSAQIETSAGADTVYIWFKKNGTNIGDSASKAVLANNTAQIMTVNILDEAAANDYYEIAYQNLNGHATVLAEAASGNIPTIPSVIATVFQIR